MKEIGGLMKPNVFNHKGKDKILWKPICILLILILLGISSHVAAELVEFKGTGTISNGEPLTLIANLVRPNGDGPFPAVIMMHGCSGDTPYQDDWEKRFVQWGYVVLRVDSMTPRKKLTFCDLPMETIQPRAQDAYDAKAYLMELPFVNKQKIGLVGWSHGAMAALSVVDDSTPIENRKSPFQCAVLFYPYCSGLNNLNAPLLILVGEKDDWCPPSTCKPIVASNNSQFEITLKIYENATHAFDWDGLDTEYEGHILKYNPEATKDAVSQVQKFLAKNLK
jgi:dienelactone hydrolase